MQAASLRSRGGAATELQRWAPLAPMSVTCVLHEVTDDQIKQLLANPVSIHSFLRWDPPKQSWWHKLLGRVPDYSQVVMPFFDLGKSWEAVHYVLTGTKRKAPSPLGFLISGGKYIGDEDVGYGPARALSAIRVAKVNRALQEITPEIFASRIDLEKMQPLHIYGAPLQNDTEELTYFLQDYAELRNYILQTANKNCGLIIQFV